VEFAKGIKISEEDTAKLNGARKGFTFENAPDGQAEVEGQSRDLGDLTYNNVECPWCGKMQWIQDDPREYLWYACCFCNGAYLAPLWA
jgi:hypothetical protein